jgi:hypothetical protein
MAERMSLRVDEGLLEVVTTVDTLQPGQVLMTLLRDGQETACFLMTHQQARVLATHLDVCSEMAEVEADCDDAGETDESEENE